MRKTLVDGAAEAEAESVSVSVWFAVAAAVLLSLLLAACAGKSVAPGEKKTGALLAANLTRDEAEARAALVSGVRYSLAFDLPEREQQYSGRAEIRFLLKRADNLRIDFQKGKVKRALVNGAPIQLGGNENFLIVPAAGLKAGENLVALDFEQNYSRDSDGLMWSEDPEDKSVYVHTNLEPYDASRVFPCFDQPDIKATYTMQVTAPKAWTVVTSVREANVEDAGAGTRRWTFPESATFSTYIWSLHAGPFKVWEDRAGNIPLRLFARPSLAKYVNVKDWFTFTKQGFRFFNAYFDFPYPYKKYDQLIVPEFGSGGMENVAAVTYNEFLVKRGNYTREDRRRVAGIVLHEMAHMWFGDLVTMKWWNDLWLNESFATYMAALAMAEATEFTDSWRHFHGTKEWAYWEDQLVTTHPIEANVADTQNAMTNFDGITYGKGASVLKQIAYFLGPEQFRDGVRIYFKRHAHRNATLKDFLTSLEDGSGRKLTDWQREWLQTAGVNFLGVHWECEAGKIVDLVVEQKPDDATRTLRSHSFELALLRDGRRGLETFWRTKLEIAGSALSVPAARGRECPAVAYPNLNDHGYFRAELNPESRARLAARIQTVRDPMLRQMLWQDLWSMVYHAKMKYSEFGRLLLSDAMVRESDERILRDLLGLTQQVLEYYQFDKGLESPEYAAFANRLEEITWAQFQGAKPGSDRQKIWFDSMVGAARSKAALTNLKRILTGELVVTQSLVDQDRRWSIVQRLASRGHADARALLESEKARDPSKSGVDRYIVAKAALPEWERKQHIIQQFKEPKPQYSLSQLRGTTRALFPLHQEELRKKFQAEFFTDLIEVAASQDVNFVATFSSLAPMDCHPEFESRVAGYLNSRSDLYPTVEKRLKVSKQESERCRKVVELERARTAL